MEILKQTLNKIKSVSKPSKKFLVVLIYGLIGVAGKRTFRNLSRYMVLDEHTFSRQMAKKLDFVEINVEMIKAQKNNQNVLIGAQDTSFASKSGKLTDGLDFFWNGCTGKAEKGLEIDVIAAIKIDGKKDGYTISSQQTPAIQKSEKKEKKKNKSTNEPTRIDFYLGHVKKVIEKIKSLGIQYMAVDAFFAKAKYVSGVVSLGLHVISKLRKDARFRRPFTGAQKARGRKRLFEMGRASINDFNNSAITEVAVDDKEIELRECILYSESLKRKVKVVLARRLLDKNNYQEALLFSTDLEISALQIFQFYTARFQIEFIFRDAKNFTGLTDCQSRDARRLHYHFNASLLALNVARIEDAQQQKINQTQHPFSMTNWARKYHVEIVINRFISMFGFDLTLIKSHPDYNNMLTFGNVRH